MDDEVSVFERAHGDKKLLVGLNTSEEAKDISFDYKADGKIVDLYGNSKIRTNSNKINIKIPSRNVGGTVVLVNETEIPEGFDFDSANTSKLPILIALGLFGLVVVIFLLNKNNKVKAQ